MFFEKNTDDQRVYRAKYGDNDCIMRIKKNIIPPFREDWKITKEILRIFFSLRRIKLLSISLELSKLRGILRCYHTRCDDNNESLFDI